MVFNLCELERCTLIPRAMDIAVDFIALEVQDICRAFGLGLWLTP